MTAEITVYHVLNWFFLYSFLGWLWESSYVSIKNRKLVNRGFMTGPFCTIYGCGAVSVYLIMYPFKNHIVVLFLGGMLVATLLEYVTALVMETLFHTSWWNYEDNKFNVRGRICLGASLGWGIFTLALFKVFHPAVSYIVSLYPENIGWWMVGILSAVCLVDFINSVSASLHLSQGLEKMEAALEELSDYITTTRLFESGEELKLKLEEYAQRYETWKVKDQLYKGREYLLEKTEHLRERTDRREIEEFKEIIGKLNEKYGKSRKKIGAVSRRYLKAYPNLKNRRKKNKK